MKKTISLLFLALSFSAFLPTLAHASHTEIVDGDRAYEIYKSLPGVACQEYRLQNYIALTKYQTKNCNERQTDLTKWECTGQFTLKKGKIAEVISVSCSRDVND